MSWRETIMAMLGMGLSPSIHDQRVHDAANREQVALASLEIVQRRTQRALAALDHERSGSRRIDELRETAEGIRQSLSERERQDTLDAFVRGRRE